MQDGTTTLLNVTGNVRSNGDIIIKKIIGDIMRKGKSIGKTKTYENKHFSWHDLYHQLKFLLSL